MKKPLIIPTEVRVCATCSYWDGQRKVDRDVAVVVVAESCRGECLAQLCPTCGPHPADSSPDCAWESLHEDETPPDDPPAGDPPGKPGGYQ